MGSPGGGVDSSSGSGGGAGGGGPSGNDGPGGSDNDRGGAREDRESKADKSESFDRAMDNANRPDRAAAAAPESTAVTDDDDDRPATDKPDDRPDRAAGPPGVGAPPSAPSPADAPATTDDEDEGSLTDRAGGFFGDLAETLSAPPTDAEGNRRSTSPVADRLNNTVSYDFNDVFGPPAPEDPGLTPGQSAALAETAAVMNGYAFGPAIPSTADMVLDGIMPGAPGPLSATPIGQQLPEERGFVDNMYDTAAYGAGFVVGAGERALDLASELPGAAWEGVNMVNDAAGTVLDTAVGWTGIDLFEGHAQRNAARGQAMVDGVTGLPGQIAEGWATFDGNLEAGNYYDAGRQTGSLAFDVAGIAVPASKVGALGRVDDVVPVGGLGRSDPPEIARQKQDGHIAGTPQHQNRERYNKPTSVFDDSINADDLTREAWDKGTQVEGRTHGVREYDFGTRIGRAPNGEAQTKVRVHQDSQGRIHGHPSGSGE